MPLVMPPVRQVPTPNYTPSLIRHDLVIVHRTEGGYAGSVAWLCNLQSKASAHLVMKADGTEVTQLVPLQFKAWAQVAFNSAGISVEVEGFTRDGFNGAVARSAAKVVAWLCRAYAIPPEWARSGQGRGVCQHHDLGAAGGGHVDCCGVGSPDWVDFMSAVRTAWEAFGGGILPAFALHGLPGPQQALTPPDAPPEASHGGAARIDPAATIIAHPTASGFAPHSIADLQWRLNRIGGAAQVLKVDGFFGPQTQAALRQFQASRALKFVDGMIGPESWAALDRAMGA